MVKRLRLSSDGNYCLLTRTVFMQLRLSLISNAAFPQMDVNEIRILIRSYLRSCSAAKRWPTWSIRPSY